MKSTFENIRDTQDGISKTRLEKMLPLFTSSFSLLNSAFEYSLVERDERRINLAKLFPNSKLKSFIKYQCCACISLVFFLMIAINLYSKTIKNHWQVILLRFVLYTLKHSTNVQRKCDASLKFEVQSSSISFITIFRNTPPRPLFLTCLRASFVFAEGSVFN